MGVDTNQVSEGDLLKLIRETLIASSEDIHVITKYDVFNLFLFILDCSLCAYLLCRMKI